MSEEDKEIDASDGREAGWFWIEDDIIDVYGPELGTTGVAVYAKLARHANAHGVAFPSVSGIARSLRVKRETVRKALIKLLQPMKDGTLLAKTAGHHKPKGGGMPVVKFRLLTATTGRSGPSRPAESGPEHGAQNGRTTGQKGARKETLRKETTGKEGEATRLSPDFVPDWEKAFGKGRKLWPRFVTTYGDEALQAWVTWRWERCREYFLEATTKRAEKKDWDNTFLRWLAKDAESRSLTPPWEWWKEQAPKAQLDLKGAGGGRREL